MERLSEFLDEIKSKIKYLENEKLDKENEQRLQVFKNSLHVLEKYKDHDLIKYEIIYQNYISRFSKAYVSCSQWYVGDSYIDYVKNKPLSDYKQELVSRTIFLILLKNFCL